MLQLLLTALMAVSYATGPMGSSTDAMACCKCSDCKCGDGCKCAECADCKCGDGCKCAECADCKCGDGCGCGG